MLSSHASTSPAPASAAHSCHLCLATGQAAGAGAAAGRVVGVSALASLQRLAITCPEVPAAVPKLGRLTELWLDQLGSAGGGVAIDLAGIAGLTNLG